MKYRIVATTLICLLFTACDNNSSDNNNSPANNQTTPRLSAGPHLGFIVGFDVLDADMTSLAETLSTEAISAGKRTARIQLDWAELEPQPGFFNQEELTERLVDAKKQQQSVFVTLSTLDTGELTIPADLMAADGKTAAAGLELDGPIINRRMREFLAWLIPELAAYNIWGLSLANEPSTNIGAIAEQEIIGFLTQSADYARTLDEYLAITVTLASTTDPALDAFTSEIIRHLDIGLFNYYCLAFENLQTTDKARWSDDLDLMINAAEGRDVFFQELGCPAGYSDLGVSASTPAESIGATPQIQREFFQYMFDHIISREQLRGASVFQLFDWSPELADSFTQFLINPDEPGSELTAAALREWLGTVGMCRWSNGNCRPVWSVYLDAVSRAASVRSSLIE
ncbi:MAG: hypothetical protein V3U76_18175 [Granulosicoccus sp.]